MSDFFSKVASGADKVEQEFLGPDYAYQKHIRNPTQLGMSGTGSMSAMAKDVAGIIDYVELLVSGTGPATQRGGPLGDAFFLKTGGQCTTSGGDVVTRSIYVNNIPDGTIPGLTQLAGFKFTMFEGLLPGILEDIGKLNPLPLFSSFMQGANPPCTLVSKKVTSGASSGYVANSELEGFENRCNSLFAAKNSRKLKSGAIPNLYRTGFGLLLLYLLYKMFHKN